MFHFLKSEYGTIKNGKWQLLKMARSRFVVILIKSEKGLEIVPSLRHWAKKNMLEMLDIQHNSIWPIFILIAIRIKKNKHKCNFYYVAVPMTSKVLKFQKNADFTKTQKSRYLKNKTFFFRQIKKSLITHQQLLYGKKIVL